MEPHRQDPEGEDFNSDVDHKDEPDDCVNCDRYPDWSPSVARCATYPFQTVILSGKNSLVELEVQELQSEINDQLSFSKQPSHWSSVQCDCFPPISGEIYPVTKSGCH
eukprot:sb/3477496/